MSKRNDPTLKPPDGKTTHPFRRAWYSMKTRCLNVKGKDYKNYGGRGIKVCESWMIFDNFYADMFSAWSEGLQLDRIDNDGNYEPSNCRWATSWQNMKNRRNKSSIQSLYPGVTWNKGTSSWQVNITKSGFETEEEAYATYKFIAEKLSC